jgi:uncharacterized PurR-regulated membrane protein YhhQ (DUF165 family)
MLSVLQDFVAWIAASTLAKLAFGGLLVMPLLIAHRVLKKRHQSAKE